MEGSRAAESDNVKVFELAGRAKAGAKLQLSWISRQLASSLSSIIFTVAPGLRKLWGTFLAPFLAWVGDAINLHVDQPHKAGFSHAVFAGKIGSRSNLSALVQETIENAELRKALLDSKCHTIGASPHLALPG